MAELGQQSMLEKPKPSSAIVPRGMVAWWGIDPSTRGISIAVAAADKHYGVLTEPTPASSGPSRLRQSLETGRVGARRACKLALPGLIVVEQPSGQKVNNELVMAVGALIAGVLDELDSEMNVVPQVRMVVPSWWKARACGNGGIKKTYVPRGGGKPKPLPPEEYAVLKWARLNGYGGSSWDEADAMAMAEAGRGEWALLER